MFIMLLLLCCDVVVTIDDDDDEKNDDDDDEEIHTRTPSLDCASSHFGTQKQRQRKRLKTRWISPP